MCRAGAPRRSDLRPAGGGSPGAPTYGGGRIPILYTLLRQYAAALSRPDAAGGGDGRCRSGATARRPTASFTPSDLIAVVTGRLWRRPERPEREGGLAAEGE